MAEKGDRWAIVRQWRGQLFGAASFGRYVALGVSGIVIDIFSFGLFVFIGLFPLLATMFASFLGIVTNYVANALFNFRVRLRGQQAVRFVTVGLVGLFVAAGFFQTAVELGAGVWWAKVLSLAIVVPVQFLVNRAWTFR